MPKPLGISKDPEYKKNYYKNNKPKFTTEYIRFRYAKNKYPGVTDDDCRFFGKEDVKLFGRILILFQELNSHDPKYEEYLLRELLRPKAVKSAGGQEKEDTWAETEDV